MPHRVRDTESRLTSGLAAPVMGANNKNQKNTILQGGEPMLVVKALRVLGGLIAATAVLGMAVSATAQEKKIRIGVIFDLTGPLAGGGSELQYTGAKIMLDHYAKPGGEGYN